MRVVRIANLNSEIASDRSVIESQSVLVWVLTKTVTVDAVPSAQGIAQHTRFKHDRRPYHESTLGRYLTLGVVSDNIIIRLGVCIIG